MNQGKFERSKETVLKLLRLGMPKAVIEAYTGFSRETVRSYVEKLRTEKEWPIPAMPLAESAPKMLSVLADISYKREGAALSEFGLAAKQELVRSLNGVLGVEEIIRTLEHGSRHLYNLRRFGFNSDIPQEYRDFLNALNYRPVKLDKNGQGLWQEYLKNVSYGQEMPVRAKSLASWRDETIDKILGHLAESIRDQIAPVFDARVCQLIDEEILPFLRPNDASLLKAHFGIGTEKTSINELAKLDNRSFPSMSRILNRALVRVKSGNRQETLLAFPLTWSSIREIVAKFSSELAEIKEKNRQKRLPGSSDDMPITLKTKIVDLDFSVRTLSVFLYHDINILEDLIQYSVDDLYKFRNMGKKSIDETVAILRKHKLVLKPNRPTKA